MTEDFRGGLRDGLPIGLGYFPVSFAFGILAVSGGLSWWQGTLLSLLNLTSAGQFAGLELMLGGGTLWEMVISQVVINLRYSLMSITLSQKVDGSVRGLRRYLFPYNVTDEIFGVAAARNSVSYTYWRGVRILPILGWTLGTLCGALLGSVLPQPLLDAMGAMLYAMFIAIVVPVAKKNRPVLWAALIAILLSCLGTYLPQWIPALSEAQPSSGMRVILCAVIASALMALLKPVPSEEEASSGTGQTGGELLHPESSQTSENLPHPESALADEETSGSEVEL